MFFLLILIQLFKCVLWVISEWGVIPWVKIILCWTFKLYDASLVKLASPQKTLSSTEWVLGMFSFKLFRHLIIHICNIQMKECFKFPSTTYFFNVGKKVCPVGCLSLAKLNWDSQLGKLFSLPSQRNFPISFKPKVAIAKFIGKMQKKVWYYENWVGRHASFPPRQYVK